MKTEYEWQFYAVQKQYPLDHDEQGTMTQLMCVCVVHMHIFIHIQR